MFSVNRVVLILFSLVAFALAQQPQRKPVGQPAVPQRPAQAVIEAAPQPAQAITLRVSADLATALETVRLNILGPETTDGAGARIRKPAYPDIQSLVISTLSGPGGLFLQVLTRHPPAALKASQDAAAKAKADAEAATATALKESNAAAEKAVK